MNEATAAKWRAEPLSKLSVDIEDVGNAVVKPALVHDGFETGARFSLRSPRDGLRSSPV
jgi:hypothetical protein